jgi:predicted transcriptional regulator YdeE
MPAFSRAAPRHKRLGATRLHTGDLMAAKNLTTSWSRPCNSPDHRLRFRIDIGNVCPMSGRQKRSPTAAKVERSGRLWATLMQPVAVATDAFLVVGIKARTTDRIEAVGQTARIPALWRRFFVDDISSQIPEQLADSAVIAVYVDYADDRGQYSLLIGRKVQTLDRTPKGMAGVLVPAARYLCFTIGGPLSEAPVDAWQEIRQFFALSHEYERAYTTDFEIHRPNEVEIYVALI